MRKRIRNWLAGLLWLLAVAPAGATGVSVDQLMQKLSGITASRAYFYEEKTLSELDTPLILEGTLEYRAPDYLKKSIEKPRRESYEIEANRVLIHNHQGHREITLDEHPVLRAFTESFRATLAGDLAGLQRYYRVEPSGSMDAWSLRLIPAGGTIGRHIDHIVIGGRDAYVTDIEIVERGGNRSVMRIDREP